MTGAEAPTVCEWWASATPAERDARVATSVMGWHEEKRHFISGSTHEEWKAAGPSPNAFMYTKWWVDPDGQRMFHVDADMDCPQKDFTPSTTWAGAGRVIEKMRERGFHVLVAASPKFKWTAVISSRDVDGDQVLAETAPEAICLAALLAVEGEEASQ